MKPKLRSVRSGRRHHGPFADALPVQPVEQRRELNPRQLQDAVADLRPGEAATAETFVTHLGTRALPSLRRSLYA